MKKNYFKFLMAIAMMLGGVSLTSCDEMLDNPVEEPTEQTEEPKIVETETGAKITINKLSDVSGLLGELKTVIEKFQTENPGKQFVLDIETTATLEATETDYTLLIPNLSEFNIVINLNGNLVTSAKPLTLKLDQKAGTRDEVGEKIKTNYDNVITLNLKNDDIDLILDVPGTTVFINKLNSIQILNGVSVVKDGGSINTYVWAPTRNDYYMYNGEPEYVKFTESGDDYIPNVRYTNDDPYRFKNLKIVKGKADYAKIEVWEENHKLDKLTIAEGATVVLLGRSMVKEIVGEGNGAIVKSNNAGWRNPEEKTVNAQLDLSNVEKISNITFEVLLENDLKDGKLVESSARDVPAAIENCTFKYGKIYFRNPQSASATVKECKFIGTDEEKSIWINIPYQTEEITGFKFSFDKCEFPKDCKFENYVQTYKPKLDENGNQVYKNIYRWWVFDGDYPDWSWYGSETLDGVPTDKKEIGECNGGYDDAEGKSLNGYSTGYWIEQVEQYEEVEFKDYYIYVSFTECKIDGAALTPSNISIPNPRPTRGTYLRYEFDGKVYRAIQTYDPESDKYTWVLVEA
jgi:hypothetical protein